MNLQVIQKAVSGVAQSLVFRVSIINIPAVVHRWITANPGQSALLITNRILIFTPAALTGPLATMGFGASGPVGVRSKIKTKFLLHRIRLCRGLASVDTRKYRRT